MRIGTAESGSTFESQGKTLGVLLSTKLGGPINVVLSQSASIENAEKLHRSEIEFGLMAANWLKLARKGAAPFKHPIDLAITAPMNTGPMFFISRADNPISDVRALRGRRVAVGPCNSGIEQHAYALLGSVGIEDDDFIAVHLPLAEGAKALASGDIDAQLQCPMPNETMSSLASSVLLHAIPWASGDLDHLLQKNGDYRETVIRRTEIRGMHEDSRQAAVTNLLVTHRRVDATLVRNVAAAVVSHNKELAAANPLFRSLPALIAGIRQRGPCEIEFGGIRAHPGALPVFDRIADGQQMTD
jgi:TRAP transporter TAXI family solute receptor